MLGKLVSAHKAAQVPLREQNEKLKKAVMSSVSVVSECLLTDIDTGMSEVVNNQQLLEQECKQLQAATTKLSRQSHQWLSVIEEFNRAMKEIGDIENWAKTIDDDMRLILSTLEDARNPSVPMPTTPTNTATATTTAAAVSAPAPTTTTTTTTPATPTQQPPTSEPEPVPELAPAPTTTEQTTPQTPTPTEPTVSEETTPAEPTPPTDSATDSH
ncbi:RT14 protein [Pelomyxa schiedti]|nr:RT14 protein [Pelomyxa schiedti]